VGVATLVGQRAIDWNLLMTLVLVANLPLLVAFIFLLHFDKGFDCKSSKRAALGSVSLIVSRGYRVDKEGKIKQNTSRTTR